MGSYVYYVGSALLSTSVVRSELTIEAMYPVVLVVLISLSHHKSLVECSESDPLILTPLLEAGKYKEAQEKSLITPDIQGVKSFSGFFTVNKNCGNNLFFWFTPAEKNWESAPVVLWLNGGPGCSSLIGMFQEIGPINYDPKNKFTKRDNYWSKDHNVIYLDQPVGTGFSFTTKACYAKNMTSVGEEAYQALMQFFMLFPNLQKNKFFITGESFSGHYIPALALEIDKENRNAKLKINLVGVMMGNPALDDRCVHTAPYMYELGIIDEKTRDSISKLEEEMSTAVNQRNTNQSYIISGKLIKLRKTAGLPSSFNVLYDKPSAFIYGFYVRKYKTRKLIHVGQTLHYTCSDEVYHALADDFFVPAVDNLQKLLETKKYTVGTYSGQLDLVCMYTQVPCVLRQLKWSGAEQYLVANRTQWYVGDLLAGWYKTAGNLFEVVVRASGHFVPTDQSGAALNLLEAFVADMPGTRLLTKLKTEKST